MNNSFFHKREINVDIYTLIIKIQYSSSIINPNIVLSGETNMKILIIAKNEHRFIFEFIQKIYASGYYIIKLVHTPTDAVLSMRQLAPDIVILDMDFIFETADATMLDQIHSYNNIPVIYSVHSSVTEILDNSMYSRPFGYISYDSTQKRFPKCWKKLTTTSIL